MEYTQIKVSLKPAIAEAYKAACKRAGVKMAADLAAYMAKRAGKLDLIAKKRAASTRGSRRKEITRIADMVEIVADCERNYMDRIPENLRNSQAYANAEETIMALEDAIDRLREAYS